MASNTPGCNEIVSDGINGILVEARDVGALVRALQSLLANPALRHQMGKEGRRVAENGFSLESVIELTLNYYKIATGLPSENLGKENAFYSRTGLAPKT